MIFQMGGRRVILLAAILLISGATSIFAQVTGLSGWNIYVDPGHSRTDNMGIFGYSESEKNVRVGLALKELLLATTDIDTVYLSRTNDQVRVDLTQRSDQANQLGAAWFHSIHSDAGSPNWNSTLLLWGQLLNGQEKTPPGGQAMADIMSPMLARGLRTDDRGSIGDCSFYRSFRPTACEHDGGPYLSVNRRTTMPSELSEAGFHTNPTQNQRNMNAEWKRLEAWTFYWSILEYHGIERPEVGIVTGIVSDLETAKPVNGAVITLGDREYTTDTFESLFHKYSSDPNRLRNGFYFFENVVADPATVTITVEADGYKPFSTEIALVDSFFTFNDIQLIPAIPPQIATSDPVSGDTHRVVDPIAIAFTRPMNRPSTEAAFRLEPPVTGRFTWASSLSLTFRPD
ncbi:MAG: N-acetylmuramoyl-L-alanine amidase, partial [Rhodothermia bacterium]